MPHRSTARAHQNRLPLVNVRLTQETDVVLARQRARQVAGLFGFDQQDQVRLATATSEIARNAVQYAGGGNVEFSVELEAIPPFLAVEVRDQGPGIPDTAAIFDRHHPSRNGLGLGLIGTRRLMDGFTFTSAPGAGTTVTFTKFLPPGKRWSMAELAGIGEQLTGGGGAHDAYSEVLQQNRELLAALESMRQYQAERDQRQVELSRLNQELEETNRGVVALHAELEERAEALRAANEIKSRFLSHMSHEFRTPLNSIMALTDLLARRVDGDLGSQQEKQVSYIRRAAEELYGMVNDLLDLAKVEAGRVEVRRSLVDVGQVFGALRALLRPLATNDSVSLIIEEPEAQMLLYTDEGKLSQILRNLVSNALKFTERGEIRLSARNRGSEVVFSVSDTGIGVALEDQERIFKDFAQIDHPIQRRVKGTGLGLPLSRRLSELLGGSLTIASSLGAGSTFTLRLPAGLAESVAAGYPSIAHPEALLQAPTTGETPGCILVIDDEEVARYLVLQTFRGSRYRVIEAATAAEGAERARFELPRLILLDLTLGERSGFDVLDELKADPATAAIPVVIHTSRTLRGEDFARLGDRHVAVLPKQPVGRAQAITLIREILGEPHLFVEKPEGEV